MYDSLICMGTLHSLLYRYTDGNLIFFLTQLFSCLVLGKMKKLSSANAIV